MEMSNRGRIIWVLVIFKDSNVIESNQEEQAAHEIRTTHQTTNFEQTLSNALIWLLKNISNNGQPLGRRKRKNVIGI